MNPGEFTKRWIAGMKNLSLENQLKGLISGAIGNLIGFGAGIMIMGYYVVAQKQWQWIWTIFILIIAFFTTVIDLIAKKQQLRALKNVETDLKTIEGLRL